MRKSKWVLLLIPIIAVGALWLAAYIGKPEYAYVPPEHKLENAPQLQAQQLGFIRQYDLWAKHLRFPVLPFRTRILAYPRLTEL